MNACSDTCLASCLAGLLSRMIIRKFLLYVCDLHYCQRDEHGGYCAQAVWRQPISFQALGSVALSRVPTALEMKPSLLLLRRSLHL